ncbi:MAG: hypothetical protein ACT4OF_08095 [Caulobacteraceae bacterium]
MLRTLTFILAIGLPGLAAAEQFPQSAQEVEVRADDGSVIGRVSSVERSAEGDIVAVEIPGLEPGDASRASGELTAEERRELMVRVNGEDAPRELSAGAGRRVLR